MPQWYERLHPRLRRSSARTAHGYWMERESPGSGRGSSVRDPPRWRANLRSERLPRLQARCRTPLRSRALSVAEPFLSLLGTDEHIVVAVGLLTSVCALHRRGRWQATARFQLRPDVLLGDLSVGGSRQGLP